MHPHQRGARPQATDDQPPCAARLDDAGGVDLAGSLAKDDLERLRMADREPYVAAFDACAEQLSRRRIGQANDARLDDQRGLVEGIQQRTLAMAENGHAMLCSRLIADRHVRGVRSPLAQ